MKRSIFGYMAESPDSKMNVRRSIYEHEKWQEALVVGQDNTPAIEGERSLTPIKFFYLICFFALSILLIRLTYLQLVEGSYNLALAEGNRIRQRINRAPRGNIYDRKGQVLTRNTANYDIVAIPSDIPKDEAKMGEVISRLSRVSGISSQEIKDKLSKRNLASSEPTLIASGIDREKALLLDTKITELPGFALDVNPVREFPQGSLTAHLLGYTGRITAEELKKTKGYQLVDYIGKTGLEAEYESMLRGQYGREQVEVDSTGRVVKVLGSEEATAGQSLGLSLDLGLQKVLSESLSKQLEKSGSGRGVAVAQNPKTGEILAYVNLPTYDNNLFSKGIKPGEYQKLLNDKNNPLFNRAVAGTYPIGSTSKPLVAAAALNEGVVSPGTVINDTGKIEIVNPYNPSVVYTFYGYNKSGLGPVNLSRAISMSSDIYFYIVGGGFKGTRGLGPKNLERYYKLFGFGAKTGIDVPGEASGLVPTPEWKKKIKNEDWFDGDSYNISIGQGDLLVSPMQLLSAVSAIANGGTVFKPRLIRSVVDGNGNVVKKMEPQVIRKDFINVKHLETVRNAMRETVTSGTAAWIKDWQMEAAGKTGTAETESGEQANKKKAHGWFVGFAPYRDPEITVVVLAENSGEGSEFAAPVVKDAINYWAKSK